jgi:hypothetical protein
VQSGTYSNWVRGGYTVTIDSTTAATQAASGYSSSASYGNVTASGSHKFFTSKIALAFTTGSNSYNSTSATGSGNMKYILGS